MLELVPPTPPLSAAEQFAKDSGTGVGAIKDATQGYFEIESRDGGSAGGEWGATDTPYKKVRVVTTVSGEEKAALARLAGAHHVVRYTDDDAVEQIRQHGPVDLVVEVAPAVNDELDRAVTRVGATIAIYANNGGDDLTLPLRATFTQNLRYQFLQLYLLDEQLKQNAVADLTAALDHGAIRVGEHAGLPLHHYPLEQAARAHDAVENGAIGKVLLDVGTGPDAG